MARPIRSNTRPSSRLEHTASENLFAGVDKQVARTTTAPSVLGDITNLQCGLRGNNASKPQLNLKPAAAPLSARPPIPDSTRPTPRQTLEPSPADEADASNPQCVSEYVQDIYSNLREDEERDMPNPNFMDNQPDINARMRAILVDWLVEVHMKYKLKPETLFLTVSIIDRFLSKKHVTRKKLQLSGIVATLIAAKYEEIYPPEISDLVYICDKAYTKDEIVQMEIVMLTALDFHLRVPTSVHFLDRYGKINGCSESHRQLAQYIAELALPEIRMIRHSPSLLAASSIFLSNKLLKQHPSWPQVLAGPSRHTETAVKACAKELCTLLEGAQANSLQAVRKKFSYARYHSVAKISF